MVLASTWMDRVANSTPIVDLLSRLNSFLVNRESRLDFPTPESPIKTTGRGHYQQIASALSLRAATFEQELHIDELSQASDCQRKTSDLHHIRR